MANYEAVVTLPFTTGLSEDIATNTFSFWSNTPVADSVEALDIATALVDFYNAGTTPIGRYLGDIVSRATDVARIDVYDRLATPPRAPLATDLFTLTAAAGSTIELPTEVSVCLSFQGNRVSGLPQSRRRGRVYLGPLNALSSDQSTTAAPRPAAAFVTSILAAAVALSTNVQSAGLLWQVWSPTSQDGVDLTQAWVDNTFDTQRRRGVRATTRTTATLV